MYIKVLQAGTTEITPTHPSEGDISVKCYKEESVYYIWFSKQPCYIDVSHDNSDNTRSIQNYHDLSGGYARVFFVCDGELTEPEAFYVNVGFAVSFDDKKEVKRVALKDPKNIFTV
jgi:hypothetical protein